MHDRVGEAGLDQGLFLSFVDLEWGLKGLGGRNIPGHFKGAALAAVIQPVPVGGH